MRCAVDFRQVLICNRIHCFRNAVRAEITLDKIREKTAVMTITSKGSNIIERSIYLINVADWASVYLAEMKEVDPVDIAVIDFLKDSLAKI